MTDLYRIIHLYRQFPKYDKFTYKKLTEMITPSLNLDQYQIHRIGNEDVGFTNWAYLSDNVEQRFKLIGRLKPNEWNCGDNIWVMQIVAKSNVKEIMKWVKDYFRDKIEVNESVKWIRANNDFQIYRRSEKYKREFHI
jgi:hemolysin-activating ACP:hemolysin acyltransferase